MELKDWRNLLRRIQTQFGQLPEADQRWLDDRLMIIAELQTAVDKLFCAIDGTVSCHKCRGACCGSGRHHLSLANLLGWLRTGKVLAPPDFSKSCPFLGIDGCLIPVKQRPYTCITFFCETLDKNMTHEQRAELTQYDRRLRVEYMAIADRYQVAGLSGLWISLDRFGWQSIFSRRHSSHGKINNNLNVANCGHQNVKGLPS